MVGKVFFSGRQLPARRLVPDVNISNSISLFRTRIVPAIFLSAAKAIQGNDLYSYKQSVEKKKNKNIKKGEEKKRYENNYKTENRNASGILTGLELDLCVCPVCTCYCYYDFRYSGR